MALQILANLSINREELKTKCEELAPKGPGPSAEGRTVFGIWGKKCLEYAIDAVRHLDHKQVGTEHILLGMIQAEGSATCQLLGSFGVDAGRVRQEIEVLHRSKILNLAILLNASEYMDAERVEQEIAKLQNPDRE